MTRRSRLAVLLALLATLTVATWFRFKLSPQTSSPVNADFLTNALKSLEAFEEQEARNYWGPELQAEEYGAVIEQLWDKVNSSTNRLGTVADAVKSVAIGRYESAVELPYGIKVLKPSGFGRLFAGNEWTEYLQEAATAGWQLAQCEFRHIGFTNGAQPLGRFYFSAHLINTQCEERAILEGELVVQFASSGKHRIENIDATGIELRKRAGPPGFRPWLNEEVRPPEGSYFIDPLIVWDLDHDGLSEVILAARNEVYRQSPTGTWTRSPLCAKDPGLIFTGVLGDFSGNGTTDFLCAKFEGLFLFEGTPDGSFPDLPQQVWAAHPHLKYAQALAVGDIDGDGALDLFLGQYKVPYEKGQMPRPYFDANDGHPWFLLQNGRNGTFNDITQKAGLGAKRARRVYNASFVDLNRDGHLDLVVVSDFGGLDAYLNTGGAFFRDVSDSFFPEHAGFGMAHCLADFDGDGRIDLLMIGMNSPTAQRLGSMGLNRPYERPDEKMRDGVTFGNRLLLQQRDGTFRPSAMSAVVARTGWSWGVAAADFDNDGWPDLYIANGHETRSSVRDYDSEFWLHDIYVGNSTENSLAQLYFREKMERTRGRGWSYGGYEKNRFFLNLGGTNFVECGFLMGVALESDSRNVIAEDLDGDGRLDLLVTTFEVYPKVRQTLQIFRNELPVQKKQETLVLNNLKYSGQIVAVAEKRVEAILSTGSYRSQVQPKLRLDPGQAANVTAHLGLKEGEYSVWKLPRENSGR